MYNYSYSADGMREEKVNSSGTVYYVKDGENVLIETDAGIVTQAHYTDFPGMWGGLTSERRGDVSSFYGFDQQSNARILVSPAGAVTDSYLYKAFGEEVAVSGATVNSLRFGGQVGYWRDEAERLYVRARHLRTDMGRFLTWDSAEFIGSVNLYIYVLNMPLVLSDAQGYYPTGILPPPKDKHNLLQFILCKMFGIDCHPTEELARLWLNKTFNLLEPIYWSCKNIDQVNSTLEMIGATLKCLNKSNTTLNSLMSDFRIWYGHPNQYGICLQICMHMLEYIKECVVVHNEYSDLVWLIGNYKCINTCSKWS